MDEEYARQQSLLFRARELHDHGADVESLSIANQVLNWATSTLGPHPFTASAFQLVATLRHDTGDVAGADTVWIELIDLLDPIPDADVLVAMAMGQRGNLFREQSRPRDAIPVLRTAVRRFGKLENPVDPGLALEWVRIRNILGDCLRLDGQFTAAEDVLEEARSLVAGLDEPACRRAHALVLSNLALVRKDRGRLEEALPPAREAVGILTDCGPDPDADLATAKSTLAGVLLAAGHAAEALEFHRDVVDAWQQLRGPRSAKTLVARSNLAESYAATGRVDLAHSQLLEALAIARSDGVLDHRRMADLLCNYGGVLFEMADYSGAAEQFQLALELWTGIGVLSHPDAARCLSGLSGCLAAVGSTDLAIAASEKALAILKDNLGTHAPAYFQEQLNLANVEILADQTVSARERMSAARHALEAQPLLASGRLMGQVHNSLGYLELRSGHADLATQALTRAVEAYAGGTGPPKSGRISDPGAAAPLHNLAILAAAGDQLPEALDYERQVVAIENGALDQVMAVGSERRCLQYLTQLHDETDGLLALVRLAGRPQAAVELAADVVLQRKGIAVDLLARQQGARFVDHHPEVGPVFDQLRVIRAEIASRTLAGEAVPDLETRREDLEAELASLTAGLQLPGLRDQVSHSLVHGLVEPKTAVMEFYVARDFDPRALTDGGKPWGGTRYLAFVFANGLTRLVDLGPTAEIDDLIVRLVPLLARQGRGWGGDGPGDEVEQFLELARPIGQRLIDPLRPLISGCNAVVIAPDGELCRLPFEILPGQTSDYLVDELGLRYVSAARHLRREGSARARVDGGVVVAGDPDFDLSLDPVEPDTVGSPFRRLLGTAVEAADIAGRFDGEPMAPTEVVKQTLIDLRAPAVLHLATHGLFIGPEDQDDPLLGRLTSSAVRNPLLRSGVVLAGVNSVAHARRVPAIAGNGVLYADDVAGMDLAGTQLVVLSACDTGRGDIRLAEGVFGLKRSFEIAGAETLVVSLWPVPDTETQQLMSAFYAALLAGKGSLDALRLAQSTLRTSQPYPAYWAGFVLQGSPAPLRLSASDGGRPAAPPSSPDQPKGG